MPFNIICALILHSLSTTNFLTSSNQTIHATNGTFLMSCDIYILLLFKSNKRQKYLKLCISNETMKFSRACWISNGFVLIKNVCNKSSPNKDSDSKIFVNPNKHSSSVVLLCFVVQLLTSKQDRLMQDCLVGLKERQARRNMWGQWGLIPALLADTYYI